MAVAFESRYESFQTARTGKITKYAPIVEEFRRKGWTVDMGAIVVGSLGGWDPANEATLRMLRISPRYLKLMRRLIVSDTIRWSRDLYVKHLTGNRQYVVETGQEELRATEAIDTATPATEGAANNDLRGASTALEGQQRRELRNGEATDAPPREDNITNTSCDILGNQILSALEAARIARASDPPQETPQERPTEAPGTSDADQQNRKDSINIHNRNLRVFSIFNRAGRPHTPAGHSPGSTPIARRLRSRGRP